VTTPDGKDDGDRGKDGKGKGKGDDVLDGDPGRGGHVGRE
jgi:hypothetical protein